MKKSLLFIFILSVFSSCGYSEYRDNRKNKAHPDQEVQTINKFVSPAEFKMLMHREGAQLIDVRTPAEYRSGRIEAAININYASPDFKKKMEEFDKEKPVLLYCRTDRRSGKAAETLEEMGFKEVYVLKGGYLAWEE